MRAIQDNDGHITMHVDQHDLDVLSDALNYAIKTIEIGQDFESSDQYHTYKNYYYMITEGMFHKPCYCDCDKSCK